MAGIGKTIGKVVGGIFSPSIPSPPEPEEKTPETVIPNERVSKTKARKKAAMTRQSGRSGTILTDRLGG